MSLDSNAERDAFVAEERAAHKAWIASGLSRDLGAYNCFVEGWHARARSQPSEWVATSERMPESGKRVIFTWPNARGKATTSIGVYAAKFSVEAGEAWDEEFADYHEGADTYYRPEGWYEEGHEIEECASIQGVTHWTPLPKPPALLPPNTEAKS